MEGKRGGWIGGCVGGWTVGGQMIKGGMGMERSRQEETRGSFAGEETFLELSESQIASSQPRTTPPPRNAQPVLWASPPAEY